MKRFLKLTSIFALFCLSILIIVEFALFTQENKYSYKIHYIEKNHDKIKVLTLGASLFEVGIDPSVIGEGVFNGNVSGISDVYRNSPTVQLAKRYVPQMENLETLIVPFTIYNVYDGNNQEWHLQTIPAVRSCKCMAVKYLKTKVHPLDFVYWSEFLNSDMDYLNRFFDTDINTRLCDSLGFLSKGRNLENRPKGWNKMAKDNSKDIRRPQDTQSVIDGFLDIAETCRNEGVRLVAVAPPLYEERYNQLSPSIKADYHYAIKMIKQKYPEVEFFDYSNDKRFVADDFQDVYHLNNNGARKLSIIVKKEILKWPKI